MTAPFSCDELDACLDEAGIEVLLATSKHSIQHLLGGHRSTFFSHKDGLGPSRYLPVFVYVRGRPEATAYIGSQLEAHQAKVDPFWTPNVSLKPVGTLDAIAEVVAHLRHLGVRPVRIGIEKAYFPLEAAEALATAFEQAVLVDAMHPLERMRLLKSPHEIELLRLASQKVIDSMVATFSRAAVGMTKRGIAELLVEEETRRGLNYEYCFMTVGRDLNRALSDQVLRDGDIVSIDSGGNESGYIGDLVRMGIAGDPDQELVDILGAIDAVQHSAFRTIRPGVTGDDIYRAAAETLERSDIARHTHFLAHGIGLVQHEAPRLTSSGPIAYRGTHTDKPILERMCISVETTCAHPTRGFIKLEDTVAVTADGCELLGEGARGWNRIGG
ncbi:M24 family metallopeptidase [Frigidibacter oleivorans]|uniref:M24 family metallopeptidase n=1 Tax=Frigidibacter oleivorans TaxID=2487129 RepID=UPI00197AF59E|nr:Xaa-Pro peptidase family protein [Frigidibacter oleivorans]